MRPHGPLPSFPPLPLRWGAAADSALPAPARADTRNIATSQQQHRNIATSHCLVLSCAQVHVVTLCIYTLPCLLHAGFRDLSVQIGIQLTPF